MKLSTARKKEWLTGYLFIAPPVLGFLLFGMIPIVFSVVVSFSEYDFFTKQLNFVGLANYAEAFSDRIFFKSIGNIGLALMGVGVQLVVTIGVALLLTTEVKGTVLFRALFFLPVLCSSVAVTLVWKWVYNYDFGILNSLLGKLGMGKVGWLTNTHVAMFSMILQGIWMGIGSGMVMYVSAIKNVPSQYLEAAKIDGANAFKRLFHITLPCVSPTTFYILITTVIGTASDFVRYQLMNDGGPDNATLTPVLYIYQFSSDYNYNYVYATAMSWLVGLMIIFIVGVIFKTSSKWVHYND